MQLSEKGLQAGCEKLLWHDGHSMARMSGAGPVLSGPLDGLAYMVRLVQPNKRDRPNNGLLTQADFFSILQEHSEKERRGADY